MQSPVVGCDHLSSSSFSLADLIINPARAVRIDQRLRASIEKADGSEGDRQHTREARK